MTVLKEARNLKYGNFVSPGNALKIEVQFIKTTEAGASFKASGKVNDASALAGRIELAYFNLGDKHEALGYLDEKLRAQTKQRWANLRQGSEYEAAGRSCL